MKLFVVGSGGREYAIIKKLIENPEVESIYCAPGNGGIASMATCVPLSATDIQGQLEFIKKENIDYVVVTPDDPLALGAVDAFEKEGFLCFGPKQAAARIESSKSFAKDLMKKYGIPTARYEVFTSSEEAISYLKSIEGPYVIKADGLALGKGVIITSDLNEAIKTVKEVLDEKMFGDAGSKVVIEEFLEGMEVSLLCFTDGKYLVPMVTSMDHKRIGEDDTGLNTGGMGVIAPNPFYTKEVERRCLEEICFPTIKAMELEGCPFQGCLYFGLMITKDGPKVIEYNARFGDPETQVVLSLMKSDLLEAMMACSKGTLEEVNVEFEDQYGCFVVMASKGYPEQYEKGYPITIEDEVKDEVIIAGAKLEDNQLLTSGGRVLGVLGKGDTLEEAINLAYKNVEKVHFENAYYRKDIGQKALKGE